MRKIISLLLTACLAAALLTGCGGGAAVSGENDDPLSGLTPAGSMELSYAELGKKYNLDACVRQAEEMFSLAMDACGERGALNGSVERDV